MAKVEFEIAKKFLKPLKKEAGIALRDITYNEEKCCILLLSDNFSLLKEEIRNNDALGFATRGKALEVYSKKGLAPLAAFGRSISFSSEDALDVFEFLEKALGSGEYSIESVAMPAGSISIRCSAQVADAPSDSEGEDSPEADPAALEAFYAKLGSELDPFAMGVIK